DLASKKHLTEALASYRGALVVVSHDLPFLRDLQPTRWVELGPDEETDLPESL
ncbi:MAG: ABC transporter ATP-binding protein, partial [Rhodococcus fascians]